MPHFEELRAIAGDAAPPPLFESTGLLSGGALSINSGDNTKFDMAAGLYGFTDYTFDASSPVRTLVPKEAVTAQTVTNIATQLVTYVGVDITGAIIQSSTPFTNTQRRTIAQVGVLVHSNLTNLNAVNDTAAPVEAGISQLFDLMTAIGPMNVSGNVVGANGANLNINKSAGTVFKLGSTFQLTPLNPHLITLAALVAPANIRYRLSDSTEFANTAVLDPGFFESPLGTRVALSSANKFSVQRIALFTSNLIRIQYGQTEYNSMAEAESAIATQSFTTEANIAENGVIIAYVILRRSTTDLTNTADAKFLTVGKFGNVSSGGQVLTSTDQLPEGSVNLYFTDARARAAVIASSIVDGDTTHSPDGNSVFDALALKQPLDATLTGIAALTPTANQGIYASGTDTFSAYSLTAGGRALGGVAGTADTFPYFSASNTASLASITAGGRALAALAGVTDTLAYYTSSSAAATTALTAFARTLIDDPDAATARTTLGLGSGDSPTFTGITTTGLATLAQATNAGALQATKSGATAVTPAWQMNGTAAASASQGWNRWTADANGPNVLLSKSRGAAVGTHTVVQNGDIVGRIGFLGSDGAAFFEAARIDVTVASTPGTGSVSGQMSLMTTAIGGGSATAALTLQNDQSALFGGAATIPTTLVVGNSAAIPTNTRVLIDRIGTGTLPTLPGGTALTLQGNNAASNNNYLVNIAGASGQAGIRFGDSASANQGRIDYDNATDGFSFFTNNASAMTLSSAGALAVVGTTSTGGLTSTNQLNVQYNSANMILATGATGQSGSFYFGNAGIASANLRWRLMKSSAAESGSNAGSDFIMQSLSDAGALISNVLVITRSSSAAAFSGGLSAASLRNSASAQGTLGVLVGGGSGGVASTAADDLVIDGDTAVGMTMLSTTTGTCFMAFGDSGAPDQGTMQYDNNGDIFRWRVGGTGNRMTLSSSAFSVAPDATFAGSVDIGALLTGSNIYNTYTPTLTAITNVSASSANLSGWIRIGNAVLVFAQISVTATAAAALTVIDISLPVASNFGAATQCVGSGSILTAGTEVAGVAVSANATNDRARATFVSTSNAARTYTVMFGYIVI